MHEFIADFNKLNDDIMIGKIRELKKDMQNYKTENFIHFNYLVTAYYEIASVQEN